MGFGHSRAHHTAGGPTVELNLDRAQGEAPDVTKHGIHSQLEVLRPGAVIIKATKHDADQKMMWLGQDVITADLLSPVHTLTIQVDSAPCLTHSWGLICRCSSSLHTLRLRAHGVDAATGLEALTPTCRAPCNALRRRTAPRGGWTSAASVEIVVQAGIHPHTPLTGSLARTVPLGAPDPRGAQTVGENAPARGHHRGQRRASPSSAGHPLRRRGVPAVHVDGRRHPRSVLERVRSAVRRTSGRQSDAPSQDPASVRPGDRPADGRLAALQRAEHRPECPEAPAQMHAVVPHSLGARGRRGHVRNPAERPGHTPRHPGAARGRPGRHDATRRRPNHADTGRNTRPVPGAQQGAHRAAAGRAHSTHPPTVDALRPRLRVHRLPLGYVHGRTGRGGPSRGCPPGAMAPSGTRGRTTRYPRSCAATT